MLQKLNFAPIQNSKIFNRLSSKKTEFKAKNTSNPVNQLPKNAKFTQIALQTSISNSEDKKKYEFILNLMKDCKNCSLNNPNQQLEYLLKTGKLLNRDSNDKTSVLDNLYEIATTKRAEGLDSKVLIASIIDNITAPQVIPQTFGDIPQDEKNRILSKLSPDEDAAKNPKLMDAQSGVCAAASCEVKLAHMRPAEYSRWVNKLSSEEKQVVQKINLSSLSKNPLEATTILEIMEANTKNFTFDTVDVIIKADKNAYLRAQNQTKNWDPGERNAANVLVQSAIMQTGSQNSYDSLTDMRAGTLSSNPQGLIEIEKTYVESLMLNKEITSLVYQNLDDDDNLVGYNCSFNKIQQHLTDTLDTGNDIIIGIVDTNQSAGRTQLVNYDPAVDGQPNKVINGHEITIIGYQKDAMGNVNFTCVDTDDESPQFVTYSAKDLIPKIHHAGYPAYIVEDDALELLKKEIQNTHSN